MNQAIVRHTYTASISFTQTPDEATRKRLNDAGFTYHGISRQWVRKQEQANVLFEPQALEDVKA